MNFYMLIYALACTILSYVSWESSKRTKKLLAHSLSDNEALLSANINLTHSAKRLEESYNKLNTLLVQSLAQTSFYSGLNEINTSVKIRFAHEATALEDFYRIANEEMSNKYPDLVASYPDPQVRKQLWNDFQNEISAARLTPKRLH